MWYIFNSDKRLVAICDGEPDSTDLASRNEFAVYSEENIEVREVGLNDNNEVVRIAPTPLTKEEIIEQQLALLDNEYDKKFDSITLAWAAATMNDDADTAAARLADKETLISEYQNRREAIVNG